VVTIRDIAERLNVSESTVSRALRGKSNLRPETIRSVQEEARKLGYVPNVVARSLASQRTGLVGLALPSLDYAHGEFHSELLRGVEHSCANHGYYLLYFPARELFGDRFHYHSFLDGIIILGCYDPKNRIRARLKKPLIVLDQSVRGTLSVTSENRAGAKAAAEHLLALGHRKFLFIGGDAHHATVRERLLGVRDAVETSGGELKTTYADWRHFAAGKEAVTQALEENRFPFTAVIAANDMLGIGALQGLQAAGRNVPDEISVIGFDDTMLCRVVTPTLSSVRQMPFEMGAAALDALHGMIEKAPYEIRSSWGQQVVARSSTGPAPRS
jgi:LacI family transcriptional regulator